MILGVSLNSRKNAPFTFFIQAKRLLLIKLINNISLFCVIILQCSLKDLDLIIVILNKAQNIFY